MLTIPQFLEFPTTEDTSALVSFFLKLLEQKNKGLFLHSQQVANYAVCTAIKMGLPLTGCVPASLPGRRKYDGKYPGLWSHHEDGPPSS